MNVNDGDGNGFVNAPERDADQLHDRLAARVRSRRANPCTTAGGTGSLHDHAELGGHRRHDGQRAHDGVGRRRLADAAHERRRARTPGPATKTWVDARIAIAPNATNEVGQPHTFTVTLEKDTGDGPASSRPRASTSTSR